MKTAVDEGLIRCPPDMLGEHCEFSIFSMKDLFSPSNEFIRISEDAQRSYNVETCDRRQTDEMTPYNHSLTLFSSCHPFTRKLRKAIDALQFNSSAPTVTGEWHLCNGALSNVLNLAAWLRRAFVREHALVVHPKMVTTISAVGSLCPGAFNNTWQCFLTPISASDLLPLPLVVESATHIFKRRQALEAVDIVPRSLSAAGLFWFQTQFLCHLYSKLQPSFSSLLHREETAILEDVMSKNTRYRGKTVVPGDLIGDFTQRNCIGVHLRRFTHVYYGFNKASNLTATMPTVLVFADRYNIDCIFLATDDPVSAAVVSSLYPQFDWIIAPWPRHQYYRGTIEDLMHTGLDASLEFARVMTDIDLLSRCQVLVGNADSSVFQSALELASCRRGYVVPYYSIQGFLRPKEQCRRRRLGSRGAMYDLGPGRRIGIRTSRSPSAARLQPPNDLQRHFWIPQVQHTYLERVDHADFLIKE